MAAKGFDIKKLLVFNQFTAVLTVVLLLFIVFWGGGILQRRAEADAYDLKQLPALLKDTSSKRLKELYETYKLNAEIRQIRSDTSGSLFWLKLIGLFVTVGGAIWGYLLAQTRTSRERLASEQRRNDDRLQFEHRKDVDAAYQQIVQELSAKERILRASAAVKLGAILNKFPDEWQISEAREKELIVLTKQILAAALAIEKDGKVLKTITIALVLHKTNRVMDGREMVYGLADNLDLSHANAFDAYWAKVDFTNADFYQATLKQASFRLATLANAQFREANCQNTVFIKADCRRANFKLSDLRKADFSGADLSDSVFENARVHGAVLSKETKITRQPGIMVDISETGDGSEMTSFASWYENAIV